MNKKSVVVIVIFSILIIVFIVVYIALSNFFTKSYYQQTFLMEDEGMEPTIAKGDELKSDGQYENLQRGDIVVVASPVDQQPLVRRVVGLPNELVTFESGNLEIVNAASPEGFILDEPYVHGVSQKTKFATVLKDNEYLILSDNRADGNDSSLFGPVSSDRILAKIINRQ
jgi:signal peptidase I